MRRFFIFAWMGGIATLAGCDQGAEDKLLGGGGADWDPNGTAAAGNTWDHPAHTSADPAEPTEPGEAHTLSAQIGSAELAARMHGTSKLPYESLGRLLAGLGVDLSSRATGSAGALYREGTGALGVANYASRAPEQLVPSTAALSKQFDIFTAAAPEIIAGIGKSKRCPNVTLVAEGRFTEDGITCLLGKPARPEHVVLANKLVTEASSPEAGVQIAVATLLAAAHTGE